MEGIRLYFIGLDSHKLHIQMFSGSSEKNKMPSTHSTYLAGSGSFILNYNKPDHPFPLKNEVFLYMS